MNPLNTGLSRRLVTYLEPKSPAAEAFRMLRTNLQFLGLDKPLQSLLVTSATPSEGKSLNSANLAIAYAQAGAHVCLVDADMRRPVLAKMFSLDNWAGLTTALARNRSVDEYLQVTEVPGLTVLTSGPVPPNPAELLGSQRMLGLMRQLEESFDTIIFDTPPVLAVADAATLAPRVSGALLVVRAGQVGYPQAQRAKEALEGVKAQILGVVLDGVKHGGSESYYYDYYDSPRKQWN